MHTGYYIFSHTYTVYHATYAPCGAAFIAEFTHPSIILDTELRKSSNGICNITVDDDVRQQLTISVQLGYIHILALSQALLRRIQSVSTAAGRILGILFKLTD